MFYSDESHCRACITTFIFLLGGLCESTGFGQEGQPRNNCLPDFPPARTMTFGEQTVLRPGLVFSNDGKALFLSIRTPVRDVSTGRGAVDIRDGVSQLVEVCVASGSITRILLTDSAELWPVGVSPDGASMLVRRDRRELVLVDTRTGHTRQTLSRGDSGPEGGMARGLFAGWSHDGRTAYLVWVDERRAKTELVTWNPATNEQTLLFESDACTILRGARKQLRAKPIYCMPGPGKHLLELPCPTDVEGPPARLLVRDLGAAGEVVQTIACPLEKLQKPLFSADGRRMFMRDSSLVSGVRQWDLQTGEPGPSFRNTPEGFRPQYRAAYDQVHDRLFVPFYWREHPVEDRATTVCVVLLGDARAGKWIARLRYSDTALPRQPHGLTVAPDGRTLAAVCYRLDSPSGKARRRELLLWDLSALEGCGSSQRANSCDEGALFCVTMVVLLRASC